MWIALRRVDTTDEVINYLKLSVGKTLIGRKRLPDCHDNKVSRNHAIIKVSDSGHVVITALRSNPCYYYHSIDSGSPPMIIKKDTSLELVNRNAISLLADKYKYELIVEFDDNNNAIDLMVTTGDEEQCKLIQQKLGDLLHSNQCLQKDHINGIEHNCPLPLCPTIKNVIIHLKTCTEGMDCQVTDCFSFRQIGIHWNNCIRNECPICQQFKQTEEEISDPISDETSEKTSELTQQTTKNNNVDNDVDSDSYDPIYDEILDDFFDNKHTNAIDDDIIETTVTTESSESTTVTINTSIKQNSLNNRLIRLLVHSCKCKDDICRQLTSCHKMKQLIQHCNSCKFMSSELPDSSKCHICRPLIALSNYHTIKCQQNKCPVLFCTNFKQKQRQHQQQQRRQNRFIKNRLTSMANMCDQSSESSSTIIIEKAFETMAITDGYLESLISSMTINDGNDDHNNNN